MAATRFGGGCVQTVLLHISSTSSVDRVAGQVARFSLHERLISEKLMREVWDSLEADDELV